MVSDAYWATKTLFGLLHLFLVHKNLWGGELSMVLCDHLEGWDDGLEGRFKRKGAHVYI